MDVKEHKVRRSKSKSYNEYTVREKQNEEEGHKDGEVDQQIKKSLNPEDRLQKLQQKRAEIDKKIAKLQGKRSISRSQSRDEALAIPTEEPEKKVAKEGEKRSISRSVSRETAAPILPPQASPPPDLDISAAQPSQNTTEERPRASDSTSKPSDAVLQPSIFVETLKAEILRLQEELSVARSEITHLRSLVNESRHSTQDFDAMFELHSQTSEGPAQDADTEEEDEKVAGSVGEETKKRFPGEPKGFLEFSEEPVQEKKKTSAVKSGAHRDKKHGTPSVVHISVRVFNLLISLFRRKKRTKKKKKIRRRPRRRIRRRIKRRTRARRIRRRIRKLPAKDYLCLCRYLQISLHLPLLLLRLRPRPRVFW